MRTEGKKKAVDSAIKKALQNKRRYDICISVFKENLWVIKEERNTNWWGIKGVGSVSDTGEVSWNDKESDTD